uniref:Uncharacterized protein n=1 Tax=Siphoviridae sp. ctRRO23 TaxID=2826334 RepID=A0A8S5LTI9_9CAUD|nr:MAG TPA: hypothetical protein [Siphoviridae sp. ctRRO23]
MLGLLNQSERSGFFIVLSVLTVLNFSSSEVTLTIHIHVELSGGKQMAHYFNILLRTASGRLSFLYFNEKPYLFFYLYYEK